MKHLGKRLVASLMRPLPWYGMMIVIPTGFVSGWYLAGLFL